METYDMAVFIICSAGFFISIIAGIIHALYKRTVKYAWVFGCVAGFCFFTVFAHLIFSIAYEDPASPNYEGYKDWNIYRLVMSDVIRLVIWFGIGMLNYLAFIKQNKLIRYLFILAVGIFLIIIVLSYIPSVGMNWSNSHIFVTSLILYLRA